MELLCTLVGTETVLAKRVAFGCDRVNLVTFDHPPATIATQWLFGFLVTHLNQHLGRDPRAMPAS